MAAPARKSQLFSTSVVKETHFLAAPAQKSQLFSTSVVKEIHFGGAAEKSTFQYKCGKESTLWQLRARKSQLCVAKEVDLADPARKSSASVVKKVHFGSSSSRVSTFQHTCKLFSTRVV